MLLVSDDVPASYYFGSERYGYTPDIVAFAKGVALGLAPLGGMMVADRLMEPLFGASRAAGRPRA